MKLKKIMAGILAAVAAFSFAACGGNDATYVANAIESDSNEQYAFCIGKTASKKTEILGAINEVINEVTIADIVAYYESVYDALEEGKSIPASTLTQVDLSDNTGGTLQIYTESGFAPFEFTDNDSNVIGVDMYLMELAAEKLNMKLNINDVAFDTIVGKVATEDNAVGAAGLTVTEERLLEVDFSNTYFSTVQCIISTDAQNYKTLEDLKGKKIGVQKGTTGYMLIEDAIANGVLKNSGAEVIEYDNGALALTAVKNGKCDVVVIDELPANKLVK